MIPQILSRIRQAGIDIQVLSQEQADRIMRNLSLQFAGSLAFMHAVPAGSVFYSNAAHALAGIRQERATGDQWLAMLTKAGGIKAGEDRWTGLSDWLRDTGNTVIGRSDISRYLADHAITVEEDCFVDERDVKFEEHPLQLEMNEYIAEAEEEIDSLYPDDHYSYAFSRMLDEHGDDFDIAFGQQDGKLYVTSSSYARDFLGQDIINDTRLEYTTDNLVQRKEIALYVPGIEQWGEEDDLHFGDVGRGRCIGWVRFGTMLEHHPYTSGQWETRVASMAGGDAWVKTVFDRQYVPDVWTPPVPHPDFPKAHITRMGDKFRLWDVKGMLTTGFPDLQTAIEAYNRHVTPREEVTRILVIDEIQSRRHQQGRKLGYLPRGLVTRFDQLLAETGKASMLYNDRLRELKELHGIRDGLSEALELDWRVEDPELHRRYLDRRKASLALDSFKKENETELKRLNTEEGIPAAPFEKNWHELCMKRMLRYAAENGFDRMVWTSGEVQADRYDIGNRLDKLIVERQDDGRWRVKGHRTENFSCDIETFQEDVSDTLLPSIVGKQHAQTAIVNGGLQLDHQPIHIFGDGMKSFYDYMLPSFVNSYGKRWGIHVTDTNLSRTGDDKLYHGIDITAEMKKSVMQAQPMFMTGVDGQVLGFAVGDRIRIMPGALNAGTLVHEYTHVWATAMRYGNPEGWQAIKDLLADTPLRAELLQQAAYRHLRHDEDLLTAEVLAHLSGYHGAERLKALHWHGDDHLMQRVIQALQRFWSWVGLHMFDIKRFDNIHEVTDRILYDLASGTRLEVGEPVARVTDPHPDSRLSHITTYQGKGGALYLRCKVDGVQQMGIRVKPEDMDAAKDRQQLPLLAARYFISSMDGQDLSKTFKR